MLSEASSLYKLIVLYMLRKVTFPMTNAQLSNFILEQGYTSYFHLQEALSEMVDAKLLKTENIRNVTYYHMTEDGQNTINYFENQISDGIKEDIQKYLDENAYELRNEVSVLADYHKSTASDYVVTCQVKERDTYLIDLKLSVPTEEAAKAICDNWQKKNQDVYAYLMKELL